MAEVEVVLDGAAAASKVMEELRAWSDELRGRGVTPTLALVLAGDDARSRRYVELKVKRCEEAGVSAKVHNLPAEAGRRGLVELISGLGADPSVHGVMVQLPLPEGFDEAEAVDAIPPEKDVDGLSPSTLGRLLTGRDCFRPAGVEAIFELLRRYGVETGGRRWVVLGMSNILGKPLAAALANMDAAFTCCRAGEPDLARYAREADILVADVGRRGAVTAAMVSRGVIAVDFGNNYEGRRVYGDIDFEGVRGVAAAITPVPGGVGPLLIAMLIRNTLRAAERSSA